MTNDQSADPSTPGVFGARFPYLLNPTASRPQPPLTRLSAGSVWKLIGIGVLVIAFFVFTHWAFALYYHKRKLRRRYL
jgi:hypothetical protein